MENIILPSRDGYNLDVHCFETKNAKAVVQIIHGMEEHQERYEHLVKFLVDNGYNVVSSNMRGHGENAPLLGHFKDKNGYAELISDQVIITNWIKKKYNNLDVYIFAHSMGTIITRVLLQGYSKAYKKVILSGYPNYQSGAKLGIFITNLLEVFHSPTYKSKFVNNLAIGSFNKKIKNPKTNVDWVCTNEKTISDYMSDPLCGFGFTVAAFRDLFTLVTKMNKVKDYKDINSEIKLLLLRGTDDPCTGGTKGATHSIKTLNKAGFSNIEQINYNNMRHEIINETDYLKVFNDILNFYNL